MVAVDIQFSSVGSGLVRPESVLTHRSGHIFAANWRGNGGVSIITPSGVTHDHLSTRTGFVLRPNGIALEPSGSFLLAHLGTDDGGLFRLHPNGELEDVLTEINGEPIPPSNFPLVDKKGRIWLTVSTRIFPRADDYRKDAATGFIILIDGGKARIVADGLGYANEIAISPDGQYLYANETFGRRLTRFTLDEQGNLHQRTVIAELEAGDYPDGLTLDSAGNFIITSIVSNRIIRVTPQGHREVLAQGSDDDHIAWVEEAWLTDSMGRPHLDQVKSETLKNISSLAFGGEDMRTAFLGCLLGDNITTFRYDIPGAVPVHYDFDIQPLLTRLPR